MIRFQRVTQAVSLLLFAVLFYFAAYPFAEGLAVDFFLRLDPLIGIGTTISARDFSVAYLPGIALVLLTLIMGRFFCGHICPMGTTLEILQVPVVSHMRTSVRSASYEANARFRGWKYIALVVIMAAAVAGVSLVYLGSPLSLVTRLYALVIWPVVLLAGDLGIHLTSPLWKSFPDLAYVQIPGKVFATNVFVVMLFAGITALAYWQPRFWCRNLCPSGALMGLFSKSPLIRRRVGESCNQCGQCIRECPTAAIGEAPGRTVYSECIVCLKCVRICPQSAITFSRMNRGRESDVPGPDPTRRALVFGAVSGLFAAALLRTNVSRPGHPGAEGNFVAEDLIRPPGALPEPDFLATCVRCGECMKACATNTLQPIWFTAGIEGLFTPVMRPRLAACTSNCNVCGKVCPTGAIRNLSLTEKMHAKVGTAWIVRRNCLVWEQDKKCLVCDEVCPYNAVSFRPVPERRNAVPFVVANRCTGCGWCETKCPVEGASAIRVNILGEVRLAQGSYVEKAREYGLVFRTKDNTLDRLAPEMFEKGPAVKPGETVEPFQPADNGLPPGFLPR
ncbi:MAG: 4Fe-4S dicluster domain-containing protein [Desulfomonilaceae bacterium]|nr:4Fe-4S dicluster domain-containing protein [Desulfomonilaceae bacterium]